MCMMNLILVDKTLSLLKFSSAAKNQQFSLSISADAYGLSLIRYFQAVLMSDWEIPPMEEC